MERILRADAERRLGEILRRQQLFASDTPGQHLREVMELLQEWGVIASAWRPVREPTLSQIFLTDACEHGEDVAVQYEAEDGSVAAATFRVRYKMDDDGPWVGETDDHKWVLVHFGQTVGGPFWALLIRDERPHRQWS